MERKKIKGAIWDIDGTLIDSMPIWRDLGARFLKKRDILPEKNLGDILFPMTIVQGIRYIKDHYPVEESEEEIRAGLMEEVGIFYRDQVPLKAGVEDILLLMKEGGIPMILATVGDPALEEAALARLGILDYFKEILTCEALSTTKQDPLIYLECARKMGTCPEETLVFEDVCHAIHTAHQAGFVVAGVEDEESLSMREAIREESDLYISDFRDPQVKRQIRDWISRV